MVDFLSDEDIIIRGNLPVLIFIEGRNIILEGKY